MCGLIAFYEVTQREDVLDAVYRCMLWFCEKWSGDNKTSYAGAYITEIMVFCYYYKQDKKLIDFAEDYEKYLCEHDIFSISYKTFLENDYHYLSNHTAGLGVQIRRPALLYTVTGNEKYLQASERIISQVRNHSVQLSGAPISSSEYLAPVSSTGEAEYCSFTFFNASYSYMSYITGEAKYGDCMEEMFYNAAQGARKKDEKAIAYLNAPNQIYATANSSNEGANADMHVYAPCYPVSCCPVNAVALLPEFIRGMMLCDDNDNIYMTVYGPCSMNRNGISIKEDTLYPFRNTVKFTINANKYFSVFLKIPDWAENFTIKVNGNNITACKNSYGYAEISKKWDSDDMLEIEFKTDVRIIHVDDSDAAGKHPIAFKYGALLFSYHIPENWHIYPGRPATPLPDGCHWWTVFPRYEEPADGDHHDCIGKRKDAYTWNVTVDENLTAEDVSVECCEENGYVWSNPIIKLNTKCYKAPYLCAAYPKCTIEPFGKYQYVTHQLPLTLVPYGCTNLRISYFPLADLKK